MIIVTVIIIIIIAKFILVCLNWLSIRYVIIVSHVSSGWMYDMETNICHRLSSWYHDIFLKWQNKENSSNKTIMT